MKGHKIKIVKTEPYRSAINSVAMGRDVWMKMYYFKCACGTKFEATSKSAKCPNP